jgi:hypothetical protein
VKTCLIVAPHFPPSNLAAVHRSRIWARHLPEFGWRPVIVTTHPRHYEEALDPDLERLVPPGLEILRTAALPTRPLRLVGDIGIRAFPFHLKAILDYTKRNRVDFLHITIPSNYAALLGRFVKALRGIPYGIDYIDPWVHWWPEAERRFSKAWFSHHLSTVLEPWAVKHATLITGITPGYFEGVLERNPQLRSQAVTAAMPYGSDEADFDAADGLPLEHPLWEADGRFHAVYAGALLPKAVEPLRAFFAGLGHLRASQPRLASRVRLHFIGTGKRPDDPNSHQILPLASESGVQDLVDEHPHRLPYLSVLAHLRRADGILIFGSTEAHYSPSKTFQAIQARRPIFAMLHHASSAVDFLRRSPHAEVIEIGDSVEIAPEQIAASLRTWIEAAPATASAASAASPDLPEEQTGRFSASRLAESLDAALQACRDRAEP